VRVLIVEDQPKLAALLARGLREEGHAADVAERGEDAAWMALAARYDAIVLDIMLPGIDGLETCRQLRLRGVWTPVLMLTARDAVGDRVIGLDAGADDYLTKPFSFVVLLARIRALLRRGVTPRPASLSVDDLVLDPVDRVGILAAEKNIAIDVFLPPELTAYTDPNRARQMLFNLLTNAVKFTPKDGGRILVSGRAVNGGVELAVADSGIGIAPEDQEKIFDEFTQVDRGPSRSLDGTGLGLTLTRRLAALVGGSVRVDSAPGVGSTFTIWLPGLAAGGATAERPAVTPAVAVAPS